MSGQLWPCAACGEAGWRNLGAKGFCQRHLAELLATFDPSVFAVGFGVPVGPMRPGHGPTACDLECVCCGAEFVGEPLVSCAYCETSLERMIAWQAEIVSTPPDVDPDDWRFPAAMRAWAQRLATAVDAGIIDADRARRVWQKAVNRDRHAA